MVYNKQYNTRHSGRYNTGGQFVSAGTEQVSQPQQTYPPRAQNQPAQPPPAQQNQFTQQLAPTPPIPTTPAQPKVLQESDIQMKVESETTEASNGEDANRPFWMKSKVPGMKKISKKEKRRRQNQHLRRIITPKNALMVLNEMVLHEQLTNQFKVEPAEGPTQYYKSAKTSFCADLTLDGVTYKGYGENKLMARNAAAEQAIRALIIKRMNRAVSMDLDHADAAAPPDLDDDPLPMIQLASYALHKLFSEWEYEGHKVPQLKPLAGPSASSDQESEMLAVPPSKPKSTGVKKAKELPLNAAAMHPAMLLTYMRPHLEYRELAVEGDRPQNMIFTMGVDVDGATYIGKASNKKEARKSAAKSACTALFGVQFDDVASANAPVLPPVAPATPGAPAAPAQ